VSAPIATDVLVIGAGPVGLFQAFQLGLQDIRCHIVDSLPHPGGQCTELYGDKPIYDIPGLPRCTGKELIERLQTQVRPFAPVFHGGHSVSSLTTQADGFAVATAQGLHFQARSVVIAAGVGAFEPRRLAPEAFKALHGQQVFFAGQDPAVFAGLRCLVVGGGAVVDGLRALDRAMPQSPQLMHDLAIDAMRLTARLVAATMNVRLASIPPDDDGVAVLDVPAWLAAGSRAAALPAGWQVTSDSIAATVAVEHGGRLLLAKSVPPPPCPDDGDLLLSLARAGWVDEHFPVAARPLATIEWAVPIRS
jgi:hypothetical protein